MTRDAAAPIALFAFKRPDHLRRVVAALAANPESAVSRLHVYCDGPRGPDDARSVAETRAVARSITGFAELRVTERERNLGLAESIVTGVSEIVAQSGRVIVLEDDIVTAPYFLRFMNDALSFYADAPSVASIHGYVPPIRGALPETFFLRGADCWGWATWDRAWKCYDWDAERLLEALRARRLVDAFDLQGAVRNTAQLALQAQGQRNSWAIRWHAATFLAGMLTLNPGRSLVANIGHDGSGTHSEGLSADFGDQFQSTLSDRPVDVAPIPLEESRRAARLYERHYFNRPLPKIWLKKAKRALRRRL